MLSADTGLHGSERIASMLTWNDFGWDMKMRPWETAKSHHKLPESSQIEGNQQGSDQIGLVRLSLREKSLSLDEISFLVSSSGTCVFKGPDGFFPGRMMLYNIPNIITSCTHTEVV